MMKNKCKRALSLALCAVMLLGMLPSGMHTHAEGIEQEYETEPLFSVDPVEPEVVFEPEPVYEPEAVYVEAPLFTEMDRQLVINRSMDDWMFPVAEEYYDDIVDFAGCMGAAPSFLSGNSNYSCPISEHAGTSFGSSGMTISVPGGAAVYAPVDGTVYRSDYADMSLGYVAVVEHSLHNGYSYYAILTNLADDVPVVSGSPVAAGELIAHAYGRLQFSAVMAESDRGNNIAQNAWFELPMIEEQGWLTAETGTGMICVNPSAWTQSTYPNDQAGFFPGPIVYRFVQPPVVPVEPPVEPAPELPPEIPVEIPTEPEVPVQPAHTEHNWDTSTVTKDATHLEPGEIVRICSACGEVQQQMLPRLEEHTFDQQNTADAYLVSPASCAGGAVYVYSCICGERGSETFAYGEAADHIWNGGAVTVQPTHTSAGEMTYTCTVCGAARTEAIPASAEHVFDQRNTDARYLKTSPSCTSGAVYYMSCQCGEFSAEETFTVGEAMGHIFSDSWSTSQTHHWHVALCEHTSEVSGFGEHTWDQGVTTVQAGHVTDGKVVYTCSTCGFTREEVVPGDPHNFENEVVDARYLKTPASCTEGAVYYKSCACGQAGTDTFVSGNALGHTYSDTWSHNDQQHWQAATCEHSSERIKIADHIWDGGVVTVQPTGSTKGERTFTCVVCKLTRKEAMEPTTHQHTFADNWSGNESYHWKVATCEHKTEMKDFGVHAWNGGVVTSQASHYTNGEVLYTCATCGLSKRETIPATHVYDQRVASAQYLMTPATCTSAAVYYVSCSCGAKGTETFTSGYAQGHTVSGTWTKDQTYHWHACVVCGGKSDVSGHYFGTSNSCTTCGYAKENSHVHTSHLGRVPAKGASCTQPGNLSYYVCECGKWFTDVTATVQINDPNSVVTPASGHVDQDKNGRCDICKERIESTAVTYTMTEGADATWLNTSNQGLVFRSNSDFKNFDHVEVDGQVVSSLNYTLSSGSTIVELSSTYLKRLTVGQHTMTIAAKDGKATANFSIKQGAAASSTPAKKGGSILWAVVAIVAILAMVAAACIAGYILYTNRAPKKKGGKFAK